MQRDLGISIKHSTPEEAFQIVVQRGKMGRTVAREPSPRRLADEWSGSVFALTGLTLLRTARYSAARYFSNA